MRDRAKTGTKRRVFGFFSLGWTGSARTWSHYETVYLLLAGLATPLVVSVHTIVSFDFATSVIPGWHTTIFPPYFVAGAIFSGMSMVLTLMIIARKVMRAEDYITDRHVDVMCQDHTGGELHRGPGLRTEFFIAWYSGNPYERFVFVNRAAGAVGLGLLDDGELQRPRSAALLVQVPAPKTLAMFAASLVINVGMWFERFVIIVTSLHRDFLPSSWASYAPTAIEVATFAGTFGLFFTLFLLFCRFLPAIAMAEVKGILQPDSHGHGGAS